MLSLSLGRLFATPWTVTRQAPCDSPGQNTGVGCHFLLQGIFPTQGSNMGLLHYRQILYQMSHQERSAAAAAAAKSLQSYPTLCDPIDCSLPASTFPGILQARTLEWAQGTPLGASQHPAALGPCPPGLVSAKNKQKGK